jgi:hypothetical protein
MPEAKVTGFWYLYPHGVVFILIAFFLFTYRHLMQNKTKNPQGLVSLEKRYNTKKNAFLIISVLLDGVGLLSYFVPAFGELGDAIWSPLAGLIMFAMYGGYLGAFGGIFVFLEELIPFSDFIPGFFIMWLLKYLVYAKKSRRQYMENSEEK